ncbi:MAG: hypothetical protein PVI66_14280 [Candidatus Aminicenantes bacterium]|jgi:hypothetical protein
MNLKEQKLISIFLIISLIVLPLTLTANDRRGVNLELYKIKSQAEPRMEETPWERVGPDIKGELIAVKQNSLLLKDSRTGADVSVYIADIKMIKIVKKLKTGKRVLYGFGIGAIVGGLIGVFLDPEETGMTRTNNTIFGLFWLGAFGALTGLISVGFLGKDKTIAIAGKSDAEIKEILDDLRKKARVPDFQ